jgi:hypothetical protein
VEYGVERVLYLENIANNVQVTRSMFPRLHKYLDWSCRVLDVEKPELYVTQNPVAKILLDETQVGGVSITQAEEAQDS